MSGTTTIHHDGIPIPPLPVLLDVKETFFKPKGHPHDVLGAEVLNGAYRYCWFQLHENVDHPLGYPAHPEVAAAMSDLPALLKYVFSHVADVSQTVEPRKALVAELGFLGDKQGKRSVALDHGLIGRYRLEVVGPSLLDTTMLPSKYRERGVWSGVLAITIIDQIVIPIVGLVGDWKTVKDGSAIEDVAKWEQWFTLATTLFDLVLAAVRTYEASGAAQTFTTLAVNVCTALADAISNPNAMPTARLRDGASRLRGFLEARGLHRMPSRIKAWVGTIELSSVAISLTGAHPVDNYLIDVPLRYRTNLTPILDPFQVGVLQRADDFQVRAEWIERSDPVQGPAVGSFTTDANLRWANAHLTEEQDADGSSAPTLVLSDLVYEDGGGAPRLADVTLYVRVLRGTDGKRPLRPEGWNPDLGSGPVFLEIGPGGLGHLFRATEVAAAHVSIRALNESPYFPYKDVYRLTEETATVEVQPSTVTAFVQDALSVDVGDRAPVSLEVLLPDGRLFDANQPFWADVEPLADGAGLRVSKIRMEVPDEWTGEPVVVDVPVQLLIEGWADDDERRIRLHPPEATDLSLGLSLHYDGLGDFVGGRKSGFAELRVSVLGDGLPEGVTLENTDLSCGVTVEPVELAAEIESLEGPDEGELTLEDTLVGGALVGAFDLWAEAGGETIFSTDDEHLMEVEVRDDRIRIERVWRENEAGDLEAVPVRLHLVITDESIARFSFVRVNGQEEGDFTFWGRLEDVVEAVAPGTTELSVFMLQPADEDSMDVVYDIEGLLQATLPVVVPPPLEPSLSTWRGAGQPARSLGSGAVDAVRDEGEVTGAVDEHRDESVSEEISLFIEGPSGTREALIWNEEEDVFDGDLIAADGALTVDLDDLDLGDNVLTVRAWKPIHDVLGIGVAEATATVRGVKPQQVDILGPAGTITVLRREIGPLTLRHSRSLEAALEAVPPVGGGPEIGFQGSYDVAVENPSAVTLEPQTGNHVLRWRASNDYGDTEDTATVVAAEPAISASGTQVGHSTTSHTLAVQVTGALRFRAERGSGILADETITAAGGVASYSIPVDDLAVGDNEVTLLAWNEFNESDPTERRVTIHRRDNVLTITSCTLDVGVAGALSSDDRRVYLTTEVVRGGVVDAVDWGFSWRHVLSWPPPGDYGLHDSYECEWRSYGLDDDGNPVPDDFDVHIEFAGTGVGPELNDVVLYMAIPLGILEDNLEPVYGDAGGYAYSTGAIIRSDQAARILFLYA